MGAMFQTFAAKERLDIASAELADIAAFRAILRADIGAMDLRPMRDGVGGTENYLVTTRNPAEAAAILTFTRLGRSNPAGSARGQAERVRYVFRDGQFIRESLIHENPAQRGEWNGRVLLDGLEKVEVVQRSIRSFGNAAPVNLTLNDWIVLVNPTAPVQVTDGAIEFKLKTNAGIETAHLFELGL
jgi:type II secretion system protein J